MTESVLIGLAAIVVLGVGAQLIAARVRLPSILLLLVFGFIAGPMLGWLEPDRLFGQLLLPLVSVSVALILYEGGLSLSVRDLPTVGGAVRRLVSIGAVVTWMVSALAGRLIFGMDWGIAGLLGAVLVVTGPTVIGPMLRYMRPSGPVGPILMWEGIVIDPIGAVLAVLVFEAIGGGVDAPAQFALNVLWTVVFGGGLGLLGAAVLTVLIYKYWAPDHLQSAVSLMLVVAVFVGANHLQHESGLLAVTVMGIVLANQRLVDVKHIVEFKENLRVLLISTLFILLAARLKLSDLKPVWLTGAAFVAVLIVIARPLSVWISTQGLKLKRNERLLLAWMAPRGIVAAAVASVFAIRLEEAGHADAHLLAPITFVVIIGTVAVYGLTAPLVARRLGVADSNPQGVLFVGAQPWVRAVASILKAEGYRVLLVDSNRGNTAAARMDGIDTYSGSVLTEYAMSEMSLGGVGRILAVTPNDWVNALAVQRFTSLFGRAECYQLPPRQEPAGKESRHKHLQGRWLFDENVRYGDLERRFAGGAVVKVTKLSEEFNYAAFKEMHGESALPLFLKTESGALRVVAAEQQLNPAAGQTIISLVGP